MNTKCSPWRGRYLENNLWLSAGYSVRGQPSSRSVLSRFKGKRANLNSVFYLKGSNRTKKTCMEIRLKKQTNTGKIKLPVYKKNLLER